MFGANPDYWTAVVGIAGAFIIAAIIDYSRVEFRNRLAGWCGALAYLWPSMLALFALVKLSDEMDALGTGATFFGGIIFVTIEMVLLVTAYSKD